MDDAKQASVRSKVTVKMPAGAKLYVQGQEMKTEGASPFAFTTPVLDRGGKYSYEMKVVSLRNGEELSQTKRVILTAGKNENVAFDNLKVQIPENRARVVVQLPKEARLWVDSVELKDKAAERAFNTPKLEQNQRYFYTMKAELNLDGEKKTETKRIEVIAGKRFVVKFEKLNELQAVSAR